MSETGGPAGPSRRKYVGSMLTSFVLAFPAKTSALRGQQMSEKTCQDLRAASGKTRAELFALYDLNTSLWKTWTTSGAADLGPYSEIWPRRGIMRGGGVYRLPPLVLPTSEPGFGWLPTPTATANQLSPSMRKWPGCRHLQDLIGTGGTPHPGIWEWMMGFPTGWTDLDVSETP